MNIISGGYRIFITWNRSLCRLETQPITVFFKSKVSTYLVQLSCFLKTNFLWHFENQNFGSWEGEIIFLKKLNHVIFFFWQTLRLLIFWRQKSKNMIIYTFFIKNLTPNNKLLKLVWKWDTIIALDDCRFDNSNPSGFFLFVMIFWKKIVLHLKIAKYAHHWIFKIILLLSKILILISLVLNFLIQLFLIDDPNLLQKIFKKSSGRKKNYLSRKNRPALYKHTIKCETSKCKN